MTDVSILTIRSILEGYKKKEYSVTEIVSAYLERISRLDKTISAFVTLTENSALKEAKKHENLEINDSLSGIPVAYKDLFLTKGVRTTASSNVLKEYVPVYDATTVQRLKNAGTVMLGKLNCDAWAHGSSGENSDLMITKNPYDLDYIPGGSSSGSSAAVAASLTPLATGTDTGGSIRQPASLTNTVGLKPTYGLVSRYGVISMASSLDSIGHFTKTVYDSALVLNITAGIDKYDSTLTEQEKSDYTSKIGKDIKGLKIGVPKEYLTENIDPEVRRVFEDSKRVLQRLGAEIVDITLPHTEYAVAVYYIIQPSEVSSNLARYDGIRYGNDRSHFGDEAKRRIILGTFTLSSGYYDAYYKKAMQVRTLIIKDFTYAFEKVDAILAPVSPTPAWKIGEKVNDPLKMYLSDILTIPANLAGIPSLAIPAGFSEDNLPIGIQLMGKQFNEATLFQIGHAFEQETEYYKQKPNL